jgi:16S rRNA processing protein RimM
MIVMGRVVASWGLRGWVKVTPFSAELDTLCRYGKWWLGSAEDLREIEVMECKPHGALLVAQFRGCNDRDQAEAYRSTDVWIRRKDLPPPGPDEVYQADLIGLEVVNLQGECLGRVLEILDSPAHPVLRVGREGVEQLMPLVPAIVRRMDLEAGRLEVDWGADW